MILSKRRKFLISAIILAWGFLMIQFIPFDKRYFFIALLGLLAYPFSAWGLWEDLDGIEWVVNLILPVLYLPALALFYFLLPANIPIRIFLFLIAMLGQYALLLCANIFSVAVIRTIQLLRAAQAIAFLLSILTSFFLFNTVFSFKLMPYYNGALVFFSSFLIILQSLWSVKLDKNCLKSFFISSLLLSFILGQAAVAISLWPVNILIASLFLVSFMYIALSMMQHELDKRLFKQTINEYLRIALIIFVITFFIAKWG